jgi:hypothetical protein
VLHPHALVRRAGGIFFFQFAGCSLAASFSRWQPSKMAPERNRQTDRFLPPAVIVVVDGWCVHFRADGEGNCRPLWPNWMLVQPPLFFISFSPQAYHCRSFGHQRWRWGEPLTSGFVGILSFEIDRGPLPSGPSCTFPSGSGSLRTIIIFPALQLSPERPVASSSIIAQVARVIIRLAMKQDQLCPPNSHGTSWKHLLLTNIPGSNCRLINALQLGNAAAKSARI